MKPVTKKVDQIVSRFTRDILGEARKNGVEFAAAGHRQTAPKEINRVMQINVKAVRDLLK